MDSRTYHNTPCIPRHNPRVSDGHEGRTLHPCTVSLLYAAIKIRKPIIRISHQVMRQRNLWTIPVSILLLAACSSETLTDSTTPREGTDAVSYARLNVNLPTVPVTRTYTPDAGDEAEYLVKGDPRIFIFEKGTAKTENDYTFLYEAQPTDWISNKFDSSVTGGDTQTGTTTTHEYQGAESFIVKLSTKARDLYALVVLNGANNLSAPYANETFGTYNAKLSMMTDDKYNDNYTKFVFNATNGFVMANAANSVSAGTDADPTVLVPLTTFYNSPAAAKNGAGNTVFVERSAVKVTVQSPHSEYLFLSDNTVTIKPLSWTLTNTNKFMYPFHRVDGLKKGYSAIWTQSRFLGNISYEGFRRTMWATDPNYSTVLTAEDCKAAFHVATDKDVWAPFSKTATDDTYHPLYCAENTFDIDHMRKGQTTAVVIMAQITGFSQTPWTPRNDPAAKPRFSRAASTRADATDAEATDDDRYYVEGKVYKTEGMLSKVAEAASEAFGVTVQPSNIVLTSILGTADTTLTAENFKDLKTADGADFKPSKDQLKALYTKLGAIKGYKGGICYYIAYIRHFDNDETPWKSGEDRYGSGDDANKKSLGRYGVVRNNWYDLTINDFAYPGSPVIPTPTPDAPDDDNSTLILSVKVNPWAKEETRFVPLE